MAEGASDAVEHPYAKLTPDRVLDALDSVGLRGDGRLTALSSYENRVYQVHLEDGAVVVAKFYRPGRWSEAQMLEEHSFSHALMAADIPVVGPLLLDGRSLHAFENFAFSVSPRRGGRRPELDDPEVLEWIGRFLARIHTVGAREAFVHRPALNLQTFGEQSREWLLAHDKVPLDVQSAWERASRMALDGGPTPVPERTSGHAQPGHCQLASARRLPSRQYFVDAFGCACQRGTWPAFCGHGRRPNRPCGARLVDVAQW